jgi:hypothetical protein
MSEASEPVVDEVEYMQISTAVGGFVLIHSAIDQLLTEVLEAIILKEVKNPILGPVLQLTNLDQRVKVLRVASALFAKDFPDLKKAVNKICEDMTEIAKARNVLVHGVVGRNEKGPFLESRQATQFLNDKPDSGRVYLVDIPRFTQRCSQAGERLGLLKNLIREVD